ncbi:hypothetical protein GGX14DRAFT_397974 [Mycena pura]|uniref:Uncharacterized protein n=1 Tax=Mycena pura TaxID=153505 RepID=A0AAD6V8D3_9AGAR|nr:hypothetical protein GGX14DRAFT_397974 [Mycena pura]
MNTTHLRNCPRFGTRFSEMMMAAPDQLTPPWALFATQRVLSNSYISRPSVQVPSYDIGVRIRASAARCPERNKALPYSLPAFIIGDARTRTLPCGHGLRRALALALVPRDGTELASITLPCHALTAAFALPNSCEAGNSNAGGVPGGTARPREFTSQAPRPGLACARGAWRVVRRGVHAGAGALRSPVRVGAPVTPPLDWRDAYRPCVRPHVPPGIRIRPAQPSAAAAPPPPPLPRTGTGSVAIPCYLFFIYQLDADDVGIAACGLEAFVLCARLCRIEERNRRRWPHARYYPVHALLLSLLYYLTHYAQRSTFNVQRSRLDRQFHFDKNIRQGTVAATGGVSAVCCNLFPSTVAPSTGICVQIVSHWHVGSHRRKVCRATMPRVPASPTCVSWTQGQESRTVHASSRLAPSGITECK